MMLIFPKIVRKHPLTLSCSHLGYPGDGINSKKRKRVFCFNISSTSGRQNGCQWLSRLLSCTLRRLKLLSLFKIMVNYCWEVQCVFMSSLSCVCKHRQRWLWSSACVKALSAIFTVLAKKDKEKNPLHYWLEDYKVCKIIICSSINYHWIVHVDGWSTRSLCWRDTKQKFSTN